MSNETDDYFSDEDFAILQQDEQRESRVPIVEDPFTDEVITTAHPLEDFFEVEEGSTEMVRAKFIFDQLVEHEEYDSKDTEIEEDIHRVYRLALEAFDQTLRESNMDDPRGKAAMTEQASSFLNTALQAAKERSSQKQSKDKNQISREKIKHSEGGQDSKTLTMDRNQLLRMLKGEDPETVDGEFTEEKEGEKE